MFHITIFNLYEQMIELIVILKMQSSEGLLSAISNQERPKNSYLITSNT